MASEREDFDCSGPSNLTAVDWNDPNDQRAVTASLVQSVCILEKDRQLERQGHESLASRWWEFFHFQLVCHLVDDVDLSIFGAIYELKDEYKQEGSPHSVIAFRGTIRKPGSYPRDGKLIRRLIMNRPHKTSRFNIGVQAVRGAVVKNRNVWLAGHSLGSSIAMLAGKTMAWEGIFLKSFLFNPPFISAPVEKIKNKNLQHVIRIAKSYGTAWLAIVLDRFRRHGESDDTFTGLSEWFPCLFVNTADPICSGYVGYFEQRRKMEEIGAGRIGKLATQHSIGGLISRFVGWGSEALHLIPSANLTVNMSGYSGFKLNHGIHQWWRSDLCLKSDIHEYR